jgi:acyl dehydratase
VAVDRAHLGRRYGPYLFTVGVESLREIAAAIGGGVPGRVHAAPPVDAHPWTWDQEAAAASPYGALIASPGYATLFAIQPFSFACKDPELGLDLLRLLHNGQELELFGPIRAGDVLRTIGEITRLQERSRLDFIEVTTETVNQRGELVVRATWSGVFRN